MSSKSGRTLSSSRVLLYWPLVALFLVGAMLLVSAPGVPFSPNEKAAYLDPKLVSFVRPGLVIKILSAEIAPDGTIKTRFRLTDTKGLPLDRAGVTTPGAVSVSFIAAYIPQGATQYVAYTTRVQTSPITNVSAIQAAGESNGTFTKVADGEYTYTFAAKAPASFDKTVTHTIGAYGSRSLTEFDLGTQYDDDVYNFVPAGGNVTVVRDVIQTATCNKCHHDLAFHGGSRKSMALCVLCHTPQTMDPDTGNSVDMPVMTHKIHMGADLPSVKAGKKYIIIGNRQSVNDYSDIHFPADARNCLVCHEQGTATQAANVFKPTRAACGACHDDVNFNTGQNHGSLPELSDSQCGTCHQKEGDLDFDLSILGAHRIPRFAKALPGVVMKILAVDNAAPGKNPIVTFSITDKSGQPIHPSKMARLNFRLGGPTSEYKTLISEDARKADGSNGKYYWTFIAPIPADAKGTMGLSLEGRTEIKVLPNTEKELLVRDTGMNSNVYFSVDGSQVQPRRTVVATEKCNACHAGLAAHGDARNTTENCVICHTPSLVAGRGTAAQPVQFATMIHKIHRGKELTRPYVIGSANFNEVGYPGILQKCDACHVNGSEQLPLSEALAPVPDPNGIITTLQPTSAACMGCHDTQATAAHVMSNTNQVGEACAACHGRNSTFSVTRVHAR